MTLEARVVGYSVVIPTYERPARLAGCLEAIASLEFPRDAFEVVVVDDGSETPSRAIVDQFSDRVTTRYVYQDNRGPAAARNAGAKKARGRVLVFTDDDCRPDPGWLREIARASDAHEGAMIGGRIANGLPDNRWAEASQELVTYLYGYYTTQHTSSFFCSNNLAIPADRFWELEGFDETFPYPAGEDRDICDRWRIAGFPKIYEARAVVDHFHGMSLFGFLRQHFRYGEGAHALNVRRRQRGDRKLRPEPVSFYTALFGSPFKTRSRAPVSVAIALFVSQVMGALGFGWGILRRSRDPQRRRLSNT